MNRMATTDHGPTADAVVNPADIRKARTLVDGIYMDEKIKDYIVDLVHATRVPGAYGLELEQFIQYGASPRATIFLTVAAKANAFLSSRGYVTPHDVKNVAMDVFRHRVIITYEAEAEEKTSEDVVQAILDSVPVP